MVAWFTVVVEAKCKGVLDNQFPPCFLIQEEGKEEETRKLSLWLFYTVSL